MGFQSIIQIFKPGGITSAAATPNLLLDVGASTYQAQIKDLNQGGQNQAIFQARIPYENITNVVFGNWVIFGCLGGTLASNVSAGASSISVTGLANVQIPSVTDIIANDAILISDGVNTELFYASTVTAAAPNWTIALGAAPGPNVSTLRNSYNAGTTRVVRLQYQGFIQSRTRTTRRDNEFTITCQGFFQRYGEVIGSSVTSGQDGAVTVKDILNSYAPTLTEIIVDPANLASSSIAVTNTAKDQRISQILSDILRQESTQSTTTQWTIWVDNLRQVHHATIPISGGGTYGININTDPGNTAGDSVGEITTTDMDGSAILNAAIVTGGAPVATVAGSPQSSSAQQLRIIVEQSDSIGAPLNYGWHEGTLSNQNITDAQQLANWASTQLSVLAYPQLQATIPLTTTGARITARDLLSITGFTDSSTLLANVAEVDYTFDAKTQNITGSITAGVFSSTATSTMAEVAKQAAIKQSYQGANVNLSLGFVVSGCKFTPGVGANFTISAGVVSYGGTIYQVPSYSGTAASGLSQYGANLSASPIVSLLPNSTWNGRSVYAQAKYTVASKGASATLGSSFTGIPLWEIQVTGGSIIGAHPLFNAGGVNQTNIQTGTYAAPTFTGGVPTSASSVSGLTSDVTIQPTWTNVPQDWTANRIRWYYRTNGTSAWSYWSSQPLSGLPQPPASQTLTAETFTALSNGVGYDFGVAYEGSNGIGSIALVASNYKPGSVVVTVPYIIGTTSPTPTVTTVTTTPSVSSNGLSASMRLQFTLTNQPTDGSLSRVSIWFRVNGAPAWTFYTSQGVPGLPNSTASQAYDITLADLTNGQNYDFGATYENAQGQDSATVGVIASNVSTASVSLPTTALATVPAGFAATWGANSGAHTATNAGAYSASMNVTLTVSNYGTGSSSLSSWCDHMEILVAPAGTTNYQVATSVPVAQLNGTGANIPILVNGLGAGQSYDMVARLVAVSPSSIFGNSAVLFTTTAQTIGNASMKAMPAGIASAGPTITASSVTSQKIAQGMRIRHKINFTETDFTTPLPAWIDRIWVTQRLTTDNTSPGADQPIDPSSATTGVYSANVIAGAGDTIDIGIYYTDQTGAKSATVFPSGINSVADPNGVWLSADNQTLLHTRSSTGTQTAVNAAGNLLASEFPGATQIVSGGYFTNVDGVASTTKVITNTSVSGNVVTATAKIAKGATGAQSAVILGNSTDNYVIYFSGAGHIGISKTYGGAGANFADQALTDTTNPKNFQISVQFNSSNNIIEGMIDGVAFGPFTDSVNIPTMPSPAGCTIQTAGSSGKLYSFSLDSGSSTHLKQSIQTRSVIGGDGTVVGTGPLKNNLPNSTAWRSNVTLWVSFPSSSTTAQWAIDDGSGNGVDVTVWNPDGTSSNASHIGTWNTSTGLQTVSGLTANVAIYFLIYWKPNDTSGVGSTGWHVFTSQTAFTVNDTHLAQAYADGGYLAVLASTGNAGKIPVGTSGIAVKNAGGGGRINA